MSDTVSQSVSEGMVIYSDATHLKLMLMFCSYQTLALVPPVLGGLLQPLLELGGDELVGHDVVEHAEYNFKLCITIGLFDTSVRKVYVDFLQTLHYQVE